MHAISAPLQACQGSLGARAAEEQAYSGCVVAYCLQDIPVAFASAGSARLLEDARRESGEEREVAAVGGPPHRGLHGLGVGDHRRA